MPKRVINLKYRQLKAFTLAVEAGSFKAAADAMAITQPSFSSLIRELEDDLSIQLFGRDGRGTRVTEAGAAFCQDLIGPLSALEDVYERVKSSHKIVGATLTIATLPSLSSGVLAQKVTDFERRHARVEITLLELKHDQIAGAVLSKRADFGIGSFLEDKEGLTFEPIFEDRLVLVSAPDSSIAHLPALWSSLEGSRFVLLTGGPTERGLVQSRITPASILRVEQAPTAIAMTRRDDWVTILPASILESLKLEGLLCQPMDGPHSSRRIGIITRKDVALRYPASGFVESLSDLQSNVGAWTQSHISQVNDNAIPFGKETRASK